jgi:hypothetical protein
VLRIWNVAVLQSFLDFAVAAGLGESEEVLSVLDDTLYGASWSPDGQNPAVEEKRSLRDLYKVLLTEMPSIRTRARTSVEPVDTVDLCELESLVLGPISRDEKLQKHFAKVSQTASYQTLFRTASGRLGIGPYTIQAGGEVCIVAMVDHPVIARRQESGLAMISLAHIYQIADGSCWPESETELESLTFV